MKQRAGGTTKENRVPRRAAIGRIGVALAALLVLIACGGAARAPLAGTPQAPDPRPASSATPAPQRGGRATIGIVGDLRDLDPAFATTGLAATLFRPVVEGLFDFDASGQPHPRLAERVPTADDGISPDGTVVILRLRQGVAWEDGQPFTAADVLFTLAAARDPNNPFAPEIAAAYRTIRAADALDPYTVRLTLTAPGDTYLHVFSPVLPAHLFNGQTDLPASFYARAPFGTGPFRFAAWTPGQSLLLTRSDSFRAEDRPYLDAILFRAFPDRAAAETALRVGTIDLLLAPDNASFVTPPGRATPIRGLSPPRGLPPTRNAGDWWRPGRP